MHVFSIYKVVKRWIGDRGRLYHKDLPPFTFNVRTYIANQFHGKPSAHDHMNYGIRSLPLVEQKNMQNIELKILRKFNLLLITLHNKCKNRVNCYRLLPKRGANRLKAFVLMTTLQISLAGLVSIIFNVCDMKVLAVGLSQEKQSLFKVFKLKFT